MDFIFTLLMLPINLYCKRNISGVVKKIVTHIDSILYIH